MEERGQQRPEEAPHPSNFQSTHFDMSEQEKGEGKVKEIERSIEKGGETRGERSTGLIHFSIHSGVVTVYKLDVGEGEVADLPVELTLPLAVDVHFRDLDDITDIEPQRCLVVGVGDPRLLHPGVRWQLPLWTSKRGSVRVW